MAASNATVTLSSTPVEKPQARPGVWARLVGAVVFAGAFYLFARGVADPDLWGHVRFGGDLWATRQLIRSDTYSYLSAGTPWVNHEWLAELVFYLLYAAGETRCLLLFKAVVAAAVPGLGYLHLVRRGVRPALAGALTMLAAGLMLSELSTVRPQLFTHLLAALLLLLIAELDAGSLRWLWAAPVLFAVWANAHGGFLAGAGMVGIWAAARLGLRLIARWRRDEKPAGRELLGPSLLVASVLGTLANPYGTGLWAFLLRTATVPRPEISEWAPLTIASVEGGLYLLLVALVVAGLALSRRPRQPAQVALMACVALLPLLAHRHIGLFAIAAIVLAGEHIGDTVTGWLGGRRGEREVREVRPSRLMTLTCLAASLAFLGMAVPRVWEGIRTDPKLLALPARAVALLRESGVSGNMAVHFDWGEYVLWHLGPSVKVSVDGRRETVYADRVYRDNLRFMFGVGEWDAVLREGTDLALVPRDTPTFNLLGLKPDWVLVYDDKTCGLYVREGSPQLERIRATALPDVPDGSAGLSFP